VLRDAGMDRGGDGDGGGGAAAGGGHSRVGTEASWVWGLDWEKIAGGKTFFSYGSDEHRPSADLKQKFKNTEIQKYDSHMTRAERAMSRKNKLRPYERSKEGQPRSVQAAFSCERRSQKGRPFIGSRV